MGPIKKIAYNCRKATFLIEKKQISNITLKEQIELKIHLAGCSICKIFQQQSMLINKMVGKHFADQHKDINLDTAFKDQLQQKIDDRLQKN
ncbi:hypothetical protein ACXZ1K_15050 [Pedobacter sp. PWIIR3]